MKARGYCHSHYNAAWQRGHLDGWPHREERKGVRLAFWVSNNAAEKLHKLVRVTGMSQSELLRSALSGLIR